LGVKKAPRSQSHQRNQAALVPAGKIGRMLATDEAERLLTKLKAREASPA
jgi:hypothetical protein